jgi:hypothetical protein
MTNEDIRLALVGRLEGSWATATLIARPNKEFNPPENLNSVNPDSAGWIKYYIRSGQSFTGELKGVGVRTGVFMIEINTPLGQGIRVGTIYADRAESIMRNLDLNGVQTGLPYTTDLGPEGGFYKMMVTVPYSCLTGE